jgi:2-(1,2-epoxy-1,2-dihydrophenyl)acetyl-CoA isomerase
MTYDHILFEQQGGVACITLNRPDKLNSFNVGMAMELQAALDVCLTDDSIRCVLLTGAGRGFCAGQDLAEAIEPGSMAKIRALEKPVVAAVNGVAAGAGANLAYCCDIILASEAASFIQSFINIGLVPDTGGTYLLPRMVGLHRATAMTMLGDKLTATDAAALGIVYRVCPPDQLVATATDLATRLSLMPTRGLGLTKKALNMSLSHDLDQQLEVEKELQGAAGRTADNAEGIAAFLEKRRPVFAGN